MANIQLSTSEFGIPAKFVKPVRTALTAAAAAGPVGLLGAWDTVAVGAVWTNLFFDLQELSDKKLSSDPKRVITGVASGVVQYIVGCKIASWACFLIPGAGAVAGVAMSTIVNVYFTFRLAKILIDLMNNDGSIFSDDNDIINKILNSLRKMPSMREVREIWSIYKTWVR